MMHFSKMIAERGLPSIEQIVSADPHVSETCRWSSPVWRLDGEAGGQTRSAFAIHWTIKAPAILLNGAKLLAALIFLERDGEVELKHTTASTFSVGIRHLLRFMTNYAYGSFAELDDDAFDMFLDNLHVKLADPEWFVEEFSVEGEDGDDCPEDALIDELSPETDDADGGKPYTSTMATAASKEDDEFTRTAAYNRLRTWRQLFEHADLMERAGVPGLRFNPFAEISIKERVREASSIASDLIPPLPDAVSLKVMATAQRLMGTPADDVLQLQDDYIAQMTRLTREPPTEERRRLRAVMESFEFSKVDGKAWHAPIQLPPDQHGGGDVLRKLLFRIRDAAVITIFGGTGVRIGELCSVIANPELQPKKLPLFSEPGKLGHDLPYCVSVEVSKTGLNDHFFMHGKLFKNERQPLDEKWLIGARPRSDTVDPPVLRAIRVLDRLYAPWRGISDDERTRAHLLLGFKGRGLPRSSKAVLPITAGSLRPSLRSFIRTQCGLADLADEAVTNKALRPYVTSLGECIRPHQWRKTFALYMLKVDDRMIPALAHHFKHLSIAVTENSYMPSDPSMIAARDSVQMQETGRFFYEQRHGAGGSFGRLEDVLAEHTKELEALIGDLPLEEALPEIRRFCLDRDIRIFHAEHGRCLIGANPDKARCHDVSNTQSWRNTMPNHLTRTPSLCSGCSNFSVSGEHAGFWRRRYVDNETSWLRSDRSTQFRVIQKRAQQAAQILRALGEPLPVILVEAPTDRALRRDRAKVPLATTLFVTKEAIEQLKGK